MTEQKYRDHSQETMRKGIPPDPEIMKRFEQNRTEVVRAFKNPDLSYKEAMALAIDLLGEEEARAIGEGLTKEN
ncbi:MAG: hypothetical protein UT13_C0001G0684 [Candidatus Pacebacteria bacterium GW2011_GWF2_38_9]|nr:MAG: hypothetical protein US01_C0001G0714 [candidate division TM6 bacterium GW2011_GWF2_28_16]KKQ10080.1 MAG: hypothetical protein US20_C0003G0020 [Candidatus Pacebacteria bacterium GW2011_GWF1_36_5]KKQ89036.1 MAG: hypothetical protein UT13_C0001G0684 [Candidatus Pacebacteria bacterium GW2011_GWF2_38_9]MBU1033986.1 hypothetical protein [Patescibacteria group bacterium]HAZ73539.1 hypothetical protein [Candidatus Paceibacterota bacterium]